MGESLPRTSGRLFSALCHVEQSLGLPLLLALLAIEQEAGLSVNELAERLGVPQQTASRYVASLQGRYEMIGRDLGANPLITIEISQSDPRRRSLYLTPAGKQRLAKIVSAF